MRFGGLILLIGLLLALPVIGQTQTIWWDVGFSWGMPGDAAKEKFGFPADSHRKIFGGFMDLSAGPNFYNINILPRFLMDFNKAADPEEQYISFKRSMMMLALNISYRLIRIQEQRFYTEMNFYYLNANFDSLRGDKPSYSGHSSGLTVGGRAIFTIRNKYQPEVKMKAFDQIFIDISYHRGRGPDPFTEFRSTFAILLFPGDDISNRKALFEIGYMKMGNRRLYSAHYLIIGARILMSRYD
jgi:hypothetical protein